MKAILWLATMLAAGCASVPLDPYAAADVASNEGDLYAALQWLDRVPMTHGRYPESRVLAAAIERRIRASHELLLFGIGMRSQHRDEEAIHFFEQALQIWPGLRGAQELKQATRLRSENLARAPSAVLSDPVVAITQPIAEPGPVPAEPEPAAGPAAPGAPAVEVARGPEPVRPAGGTDPAPESPAPEPTASEQIQLELKRAEHALERGEIETALESLTTLSATAPNEPGIPRVLSRILRQRAMLRYGQGQLEEAIADWTRLLNHLPGDEQALRYRDAARIELAERRRRG